MKGVEAYEQGLCELDKLDRDGKAESPEADALRDCLDEVWKHLSPSERQTCEQMAETMKNAQAWDRVSHAERMAHVREWMAGQ